MVGLTALLLPILLSAVAVFLASFVLHMVLPLHRGDYAKLPDEETIMRVMREQGVTPGNYHMPHAAGPKDLGDEGFIRKCEQGPVALVNVMPSGKPKMGKHLALWFVYSLVVGLLAAYLSGRTLAPGAQYLEVFRVAGAAAFLCYAMGEPMASIWKGQRWVVTLKHMLDGLIYALLTAGFFGWLWPR